MKTEVINQGRKVINAFIVKVYNRNGVLDEKWNHNDVFRNCYIENQDGSYDVHQYDGGFLVNKIYSVSREYLISDFQWKQDSESKSIYTKFKIIEKQISFI